MVKVWLGLLVFWIVVEVLSHVFPAPATGKAEVGASVLTSYVTDTANLLKPSDQSHLLSRLIEFNKQTSNQIALAIYPRLPTPSAEEFTIQVAANSKVGEKGLDNGAILFVFLADRIARLEIGYGLEGAIPDVTAAHILREQLAPRFAQGGYAEGIVASLDAVMATVPAGYQKARAEKLIPITWPQVVGAAKLVGRGTWPALRDSDAEMRLGFSFFGSLIGVGVWSGFGNAGRLAVSLLRGLRNVGRGRRFGSDIDKVEFSSIFDTVKVMLFAIGLFVALAVVVMAGSGSFGGGGALIRW
jgi:uncharacterized membrane protein YgcG